MILINDFKKEYYYSKRQVNKAISRVLTSGWYILGKEVSVFESAFAKYSGVKYCIGVGNGLEALQISLIALGIGKGDEVITVSNSAVATALAISHVGAIPIFVDIDEYFHIDPESIRKKITKRTKAIIPVHLFGQMVDMKAIMKIAKQYNLAVIEDACQAHGAMLNKKKAGTFGEIGCFSFYPTKNLGAYGDGGAIITNSKKLYETCLMMRNYGQTNRYVHKAKGLNSRLDEIQAALLGEKLKKLDILVKKRRRIAEEYHQQLKEIPQITLPRVRNNSYHAYHLFVIEVADRDKLQQFLKKKNIQTLIHYPIPIHKQVCYSEYNHILLAKTESAASKILSIPIHPFLTKKEIYTVCNAIKSFYK